MLGTLVKNKREESTLAQDALLRAYYYSTIAKVANTNIQMTHHAGHPDVDTLKKDLQRQRSWFRYREWLDLYRMRDRKSRLKR